MINKNLPKGILENILPKEDHVSSSLDLDSLDKILDILDPEKKFRIKDDREILGQLHHALNIHNYQKRDFRYLLLSNANDFDLQRFFKKIGLAEELPIDEHSKDELIQRAANIKWDDNSETRDFIEVFGYEENLIPVKRDIESTSEEIQKGDDPYKQLKDFQSEVVFDALGRIENDMNARFLIQMPTGSGKTRVAMELVSYFLNANEDRNVVWLADRQELCLQAIESFKNAWPHIARKDVTLHRLWGPYNIPPKFENSNFIVAGLGKMISHFKKNQDFVIADLIIFDEAHHMAAPEYERTVRNLSGLSTRVIGLSATPGRGYMQDKQNAELAKLFWNNIITIKSGNEGPITFLQKKRILSRAEKYKIEFEDPEFELTDEEWKRIASEVEFPESVIKKLAKNYIRNLKIAEKLKELGEQKKQVLFFGASVEHSRWMFAITKYFGYKAAHIEMDTPTSYRRDVVERFRKNEINFIFNYDIFTAGFDAPNIDVVFIARPTKSHVTFLQMIGRGMRGPLMDGTNKFDLIYVDDRVFGNLNLDNLYEIFGDYFGERL